MSVLDQFLDLFHGIGVDSFEDIFVFAALSPVYTPDLFLFVSIDIG